MPPIPSPRSSPFFRKASTPGRQDGQRPNTPVNQEGDQSNSDNGIMVVGETGYLSLNFRKKSSAEKLSDTGFQLYTLEDSKKLPKILKPKKKVSKGSKRKKIIATNDQNNNLIEGSQEDEMEPRLKAIEVEKPRTSEDQGELHNKYGLDLKKDFSKFVDAIYTGSTLSYDHYIKPLSPSEKKKCAKTKP